MSPCLCLTVDTLEASLDCDGIRMLNTEAKEELTLNDPALERFFKNLLKENNFEGILGMVSFPVSLMIRFSLFK